MFVLTFLHEICDLLDQAAKWGSVLEIAIGVVPGDY